MKKVKVNRDYFKLRLTKIHLEDLYFLKMKKLQVFLGYITQPYLEQVKKQVVYFLNSKKLQVYLEHKIQLYLEQVKK